jgi:hypothetical protein
MQRATWCGTAAISLSRKLATLLPDDFNATNDENDSFDNRSDDKGPEPEGVTIGRVGSRIYAFIGLERVGGIMMYDITDPDNPQFVNYVNNRDFSGDAEAGTAGDLGPEGVLFIDQDQSPPAKICWWSPMKSAVPPPYIRLLSLNLAQYWDF